MKSSTTCNVFKKAVALITVQLFLLSNIGFAADDVAKVASPKVESQALAVDALAIPRGIGTIKERSLGENGKLILYIQDAHCNYEAQNNISRILEHLIKNYNINFVAVEGADGIVDTSWFKAFPDEDIKKEVADYFMKKGEITGAEFLSITSDYPFTIYGAEDRKSYIDNLNSFLESYPYKEEFLKYYTNIKSVLGKLKTYIYTKELLRVDSQIMRHKDKKIKFADYARYLNSIIAKKAVNIKNYANFNILVEALKFEKNIDFDIVNEERAVLIDELSKKISKEKLSELVNQSLSFKLGKVEGNEFYNYLAELAKENDILISKKYENLGKYMIYSRIYARIDNELLFDEIDELIAALKEKMFQNDDQRTLDKLWKDVNTTLGFMNIELTNKEYEYYLGNKDKFSPEIFTSFINTQATRFGLAYNVGVPSEELSSVFTKLINFYEIALERDEILVKNMFKGMRGKKTDVAILITGGFHTKGVTKFLKEKDASYVVISPSITEDTESPYIAVLTGQKTPFEELIIGTAEAAQLQFTSRFCRMCRDPRITGDSVENAGKSFLEELARNIVEAYLVTYPDKPQAAEGDRRAIRDDIIRQFMDCSRTCPDKKGSRHIADYIRKNFDTLFADVGSTLIDLQEIINESFAQRNEWGRRDWFNEVHRILFERVPLLAIKLASLENFIDEQNPNVVITQIEEIVSSEQEAMILMLAFQPGEEGMKSTSADILIAHAKERYSEIHGAEKANAGYELSCERLGGEEAVQGIIKEVESALQETVVAAMVFGKGDIFKFWDEMTWQQKEHLLKQLYSIEMEEVENCYYEFIIRSKQGAHVDITQSVVENPSAKDARLPGPQRRQAFERGSDAFAEGKIGYLELAGGTGARLGYNYSKIMFPASQILDKELGKLHAEAIKAKADMHGKPIPWLLMTSDVTHDETMRFFNENKVIIDGKEYYFGCVPVGWVRFQKQRVMPQVTNDGEYILDKKKNGMYEIVVGGFGHGDARDLILMNENILSWFESFGVEYVSILNMDNAFISEETAFGWHILSGLSLPQEANGDMVEHMSVLAVEKRHPEEKVGMAVRLDGNHAMIEYNQVPDEQIYLMWTYEITYQDKTMRFVIFRDDDGSIRLRPMGDDSEDDMIKFFQEHFDRQPVKEQADGGQTKTVIKPGLNLEGGFITLDEWVEKHLMTKEQIHPDASVAYHTDQFAGQLVCNSASLMLNVGNVNQLIWSLSSFRGLHKLPELPVVVAKNKPVEGYGPGTRAHHIKESGDVKSHKFEVMAFHGFFGNPVRGAHIIIPRVGGFAPIKNKPQEGVDTKETAQAIYNKYDIKFLEDEFDWEIGDGAIVELSSMFRGRATYGVKKGGRLGSNARVCLTGKETTIGTNFYVDIEKAFIVDIAYEILEDTRVQIGRNVHVAANVKIKMKGAGFVSIADGAEITEDIDVELEDGDRIVIKQD
ncbi:MAG: UTP--glucose-1-phosphate uridylyltransferase, partial [Candidatus Omnitrophica bacterium]|nr:UTP--glucose-1-phosphate uridylyltransferase [Candidatus Omnitrophota bacterium]